MQAVAVVLPGKFIFLAQPHTGSSAMVLALQDVFPEAFDLRPHHMRLADVREHQGGVRITQISRSRERIWDERPQKRKPGSDVDPEAVRACLLGNERVFTVIRNPYDFLATCYVRRGRGVPFESFVRSYRESPYIEDGKLYYHEPDCETVLRWEKLQVQLNKLMRELDLPKIELGQHNITKDKQPWESYYTPKAFETVNKRFGKEFEPFYELRKSGAG